MIKVKDWKNFKELINRENLESIVYNIEQNGLSESRELTVLRLIAPGNQYYVFIDFPSGEKLRGTEIQLHRDKNGNRYIEERDVIDFLKKQFKKELKIFSYWTI